MFTAEDERWMQHAIELAKQAALNGEVPVGAALVHEGKLIAQGYNQPIATHDPCAHAEIIALRGAGNFLKNYRLVKSTLYVTLEPCTMCAGALVHARVGRLVYGACDLRSGAVESNAKILNATYLNHRVSHQGGLYATLCGELLSNFFKQRRAG